MPSDSDVNQGVAAHELFLRDDREISDAWRAGTLDEWIEETLTRERATTAGSAGPT